MERELVERGRVCGWMSLRLTLGFSLLWWPCFKAGQRLALHSANQFTHPVVLLDVVILDLWSPFSQALHVSGGE